MSGDSRHANLALYLAVVGVALTGCGRPGTAADPGFGFCAVPEEGCPCSEGHVLACYPERPFVDETGEEYCLEGARYCGPDGLWGPCQFVEGSARFPVVGDPVPCGGCDPRCFTVHDCPSQRDLTPANSTHVRFDIDRDGIVLGGQAFGGRNAYVANDPDSTVSKLDLTTGQEVGRFLVGVPGATGYAGNRPSRTAIDSRGNAYVASRAFQADVVGTVTKIGGDPTLCYDRNRNGVIDTSSGGADVRLWGTDECVLWTTEISDDCVPRALAVDANDRVWAGCHGEKRFYVLDPADGSILRNVATSVRPYGAAITRDGVLWFPDDCCAQRDIQSIDTKTYVAGPVVKNRGCNGSYGIAVDTRGRVLLGGWGEGCVSRYTPGTNRWETFTVRAGTGGVRGVTIDASGRIWAASHDLGAGPHWLTSWLDDGTGRTTYTLTGCRIPIGVGADFLGQIWTPCQGTSNVARLDPGTGRVDLFASGAAPYTYSDFTGFIRASVTAPDGSYTRRHDALMACSGGLGAMWALLYWDVETPAGTRIDFTARTAASLADLGLAPEISLASVPGDTSPANVQAILSASGIENGLRFMDVRVSLHSSDGVTTPVFRNMDMVYFCTCGCDVDTACTAGCTCDRNC